MALALAAPAKPSDNALEQAAQVLGETAEEIQETGQRLVPRPEPEPLLGRLSLVELGLALGVIVITLLIRLFFLRLARGLFHPQPAFERSLGREIAEALVSITAWAILLCGLFVALGAVDWPSRPVDWHTPVWRIYASFVVLFLGLLAFRLASIWLHLLRRSAGALSVGLIDQQLAPILRDLFKVLVIVAALLAIVQVWGHDATALLAGVGIGGLAVAFAAQDAIANVLASIVIYTDRPFKVGDWVQIGGVSGIVEEIGIRSTRIRQFDQPVVWVPNRLVSAEKIVNYSAMRLRRLRLRLPLPFDTPPDKLERFSAAVGRLLGERPGAEEGTALVRIEGLGATGIELLVQVFTRITEYEAFMEWQEALILDILRKLGEQGLSLAAPVPGLAAGKG